ncbi:MAG TPA: ATP-binding protein [Bacteroidota bacterium]|jgi:anti-sigma regulatory factor (Ser/Thr protein kinase)|nr:ATP-binding protein [Bacteroidota bacterium]
MEKTFKRQINDLETIFQFIQECFAAYQIDQSFTFLARFIVEELFTNMVKYNHTSNDSITVMIDKKNKALVISLTDYDVDQFDPRLAGDVDTTKSAKDRAIGGLGIYLVKKMVDSIDYEYVDRRSKVTITKQMEM